MQSPRFFRSLRRCAQGLVRKPQLTSPCALPAREDDPRHPTHATAQRRHDTIQHHSNGIHQTTTAPRFTLPLTWCLPPDSRTGFTLAAVAIQAGLQVEEGLPPNPGV